MIALYRAGRDLAGWCCRKCGTEFEHAPRHRASHPLRTFLRLMCHKVIRWHRPWSFHLLGVRSRRPDPFTYYVSDITRHFWDEGPA